MSYQKSKRLRLVKFARRLKRLHTPFTDRIAEVATGEKEEAEILSLRWEDVKRLEALCENDKFRGLLHGGMPIMIDHQHFAHLDRSGHLFGIATDGNHADDLAPLHALDFFGIPSIVRNPKKAFFYEEDNMLRLEKRKFDARICLVLLLDTDYDCLYLVTMFRHSRSLSPNATSPYAAHHEKAAKDRGTPLLDDLADETAADSKLTSSTK